LIALFQGPIATLAAEMAPDVSASSRELLRVGDGGWEGPIFLPRDGRGPRASGKWFFAKVGGYTRVYPFLPAVDQVKVGHLQSHTALCRVIESGFSGKEWSIRKDSRHSRTKTFEKEQARDTGAGGGERSRTVIA